MRTSICVLCNGPLWRGKDSAKIPCCKTCRKSTPNEKLRKLGILRPLKNGDPKKSNQETKYKALPQLVCQWCKVSFKASTTIGHNYTGKFCSRTCSGQAHAKLWTDVWFPTCQLCKTIYATPKVNSFGCVDCLDKFDHNVKLFKREICRQNNIITISCATCTKIFKGNKRTKYCSKTCKNKKVRLKYYLCDVCEILCLGALNNRYCSPCRLKQNSLNFNQRGRAKTRLSGAKYEPIDRKQIYIRDKWICGICSDSIDPSFVWPHLMCASADHIVPLSKGGDHTYENVRASHWLCNSYRGDKVDFDLSLSISG